MGNDGGSIPSRRELVKEAARNPSATELKEKQHSQQEYYWTTDPLTQKPLALPVVSDCNGKLYNKESIIQYLLPSEDGASKAEAEYILQGAVKSLKDIVDVKFEIDSSREGEHGGRQYWKCPVTNEILGPDTTAVYIVPCGHAFSANAVKEVSGETCMQCNETYAPNDIIPILPTSDIDTARMSLRIEKLKQQGQTHSLKKIGSKKAGSKKADSKKRTAEALESSTKGSSAKDTDKARHDTGSRTESPAPGFREAGINNPAIASTAAKSLRDLEQGSKRRKREQSETLKSLFSKTDSKKALSNSSDYMTRGYSIPSSSK
ncbi:MAG: hypothetical protein M1820_008667 [Bogoriella megaspora]|nr:MAG: hypothetical protein M1820_008667 [Bogoriella megaspora]